MTLPFSDELISAYLDGELTAEEQQYVEEQLRENADLRRTYDELRSLRQTLQAMPVASPPENLAERVLRQAERRMLVGDKQAAGPPDAVDVTPATHSAAVSASGSRNWRLVFACATALAACVLAAIWLPWRGGQEMVQAPQVAPDSAAAPRGPVAPAVTEPAFAAASTDKTVMGAIVDNGVKREMDADRAPAPAESANVGLHVEPSAQAAPSRELAVRFKEKGDSAEEKLSETAPLGGMGGAGGLSGGGQPAGGAMGYGGGMGNSNTRGSDGFGANGQPRPAASRPESPMMLGAGGAGGTPGAAADDRTSGMGMPGAPRDEARGAVPETASDVKDYRRRMATGAAGEAVADGVPAEDTLEKQAESGADVNYAYESRSPEHVVEQLRSQLNQGQMVLVRLYVPEPELLGSLDALTTNGPGATLAEGVDLPPVTLQSGDAARTDASQIWSARELNERLWRENQNVVVVNGSAEQLNQTLASLATLRGVAIVPAQEELAEVRARLLQRDVKLEQAGAPQPQLKKHALSRVADAPAQQDFGKPQQTTQPAQPADSAAPAREKGGGTSSSPASEQSGAAQNKKMFYVYFRLVPDTTPAAQAAPAAKPEDR